MGVDIVLAVVVDWASVELGISVVSHGTSIDSKSIGWAGACIALELRRRRRQNAATALGVGESTTAVKAVASSIMTSTNAVLAIRELTEGSGGTA